MLELLPLSPEDLNIFKKDMQEAFQLGAEYELSDINEPILPFKDIENSLTSKGAAPFKAIINGQIVGGAIVVIDESTKHNHLDFLYVKNGVQSKGIGKMIWDEIEKKYPDTLVWETMTPYFEKRNIHFYINRCGFSAVEFFNPYYKDPKITDDMTGGEDFFRLIKVIKKI